MLSIARPWPSMLIWLLIDQMPRKDGLAVVKEGLSQKRQGLVPMFVAVTANAMEKEKRRELPPGCKPCWPSPFSRKNGGNCWFWRPKKGITKLGSRLFGAGQGWLAIHLVIHWAIFSPCPWTGAGWDR